MAEQFDKTGETLFEKNVTGPLFLAKRVRELGEEATGHRWIWIEYPNSKVSDEELSPDELQSRNLQRLGVDFIEEWQDGSGQQHRRAFEIKYEPATLYDEKRTPPVIVQQMAKENADAGEKADPHGSGNYFIELEQCTTKDENIPGWYAKAKDKKNQQRLKEEYGITDGRVFVLLSRLKADPADFIIATFIEEEYLIRIVGEGKGLKQVNAYPSKEEQKKSGIKSTRGALLPITKVFTQEHLQHNRIDLFGDGESIRLITPSDPESKAWRMRFETEEYFEQMENMRREDLKEQEADLTDA